uniref:DUF4332 domain-containing protein n=2 Tax=Litorilinea aerophila TaxID=1204385 RepID=A0A540VKI4_9CHLR
MKQIGQNRRWLLAVLVVAAAALWLGNSGWWQITGGSAPTLAQGSVRPPFSGQIPAAGPAAWGSMARVAWAGQPMPIPTDGAREIFQGDLVVEAGQTLDGDVVVYSGNVTVHPGGRIQGNLIVYSGDIQVADGAVVTGDVAAFSGNVDVAGEVSGNIASWSGHVRLRRSAHVGGDVSVLNGDIEQEEGAFVAGNLVRGPRFQLPLLSGQELPSSANGALEAASQPRSFGGLLLLLLLRLMAAVAFTAIVVGAAVLLMSAWPDVVERVDRTLQAETALSFALGLLSNLVLLFLALLLGITLCLAPVALIPALLLLALNVVGWAAVGRAVGERVAGYTQMTLRPVAATAVGTLLLTGSGSVLWALGSCFRWLAFIYFLLVASAGAGAVLLPWLRRGRSALQQAPAPRPSTGPAEGPAQTSPPPAEPPATPVAPVVETPVAPAAADDLTRIRGIGPVFAARLQEAGVRTFADLAGLTPEAVAEIIGWPVQRVLNSDLIGQARSLAQEAGEL